MQHYHYRRKRDLTKPGRRGALVRRASAGLAAAALAITCLGAAASSSAATTSPESKQPATAAAPAARSAKAPHKSTAGGAKVRVSPYAKFRRERESADRAKGSVPNPGTNRPAGQTPARHRPK